MPCRHWDGADSGHRSAKGSVPLKSESATAAKQLNSAFSFFNLSSFFNFFNLMLLRAGSSIFFFFHRRPDSKYFHFCRTFGLGCLASTLRLQQLQQYRVNGRGRAPRKLYLQKQAVARISPQTVVCQPLL